jgi:hypothetical protein
MICPGGWSFLGGLLDRLLGLVLRFRSSHHIAATSFANFEIKEHEKIYDSSAALTLKFRWRVCRTTDRNFKVAALVAGGGLKN